jgi:hypothetical protein
MDLDGTLASIGPMGDIVTEGFAGRSPTTPEGQFCVAFRDRSKGRSEHEIKDWTACLGSDLLGGTWVVSLRESMRADASLDVGDGAGEEPWCR